MNTEGNHKFRARRQINQMAMQDMLRDIEVAKFAARKAAFIDMHNDDQDPPVDIDDMDEDGDADVQLDTLQFMQQMGERMA